MPFELVKQAILAFFTFSENPGFGREKTRVSGFQKFEKTRVFGFFRVFPGSGKTGLATLITTII